MEPDVLVGGEEPGKTRTDDTNDVPQHGDEDHSAIERENKTGTSRRPHGPCQSVEGLQAHIRCLRAPLLKLCSQTRHYMHAPDCASHRRIRRDEHHTKSR